MVNIYVQVIEKKKGKSKVKKSFGSALNKADLKPLLSKANNWIKDSRNALELDFNGERQLYAQFPNVFD